MHPGKWAKKNKQTNKLKKVFVATLWKYSFLIRKNLIQEYPKKEKIAQAQCDPLPRNPPSFFLLHCPHSALLLLLLLLLLRRNGDLSVWCRVHFWKRKPGIYCLTLFPRLQPAIMRRRRYPAEEDYGIGGKRDGAGSTIKSLKMHWGRIRKKILGITGTGCDISSWAVDMAQIFFNLHIS